MGIKKIFTCVLIFIFTFNQVCFPGDKLYYKYEYSVVKDLITPNSEIDRRGRMGPAFFLKMQKRHEEIIRSKNLIEEDILYIIDRPSYINENYPPLPLKRKISIPGAEGARKHVEYTLSDYDEAGDPQQISVYTYDTDEKTLERIESYDLRDIECGQWINDDLEEISEDGEPKVMANYEKGDYQDLIDDIKLKTVVYFGGSGEEKVDYILSDYRQGRPGEVSVYMYEEGNTLKEVNVYDVSSFVPDFTDSEWEDHIKEEDINWEEEAENQGRLTRKTVYEGTSGDEKAVYALSEYDAGVLPGRLECFDYASEGKGALDRTRAYSIKGLDWQFLLSDFRVGMKTCDNRFISTVVYKGKEDKEIVDHVLSGYYADELGHNYKPSRRSDYVYDDNGRLDRVETCCIKNGANILRSCSKFTGLKGHEVITRSYDYMTDGMTLHSVSLYEYDLGPDVTNDVIGGDGNKYTLDRVARYVGTDNPGDVSGAKIKSETYYDGPEGKEYVECSFGFDILTGDVVTRTEHSYEGKSLSEVNTYRILDAGILYDLEAGVLVSHTDYEGEEKREKAVLSEAYDFSSTLLNKTSYDYDPSGALKETETQNLSGHVLSRTFYEGPENMEKKVSTRNFDLQEERITKIEYEYNIIDALEKTITLNPDNIKISETEYGGVENDEKTLLTTRFDFLGTITGTTEYEYDDGEALSRAISKDDSGRILSETIHAGPENHERAILAKNYDFEGNLLSETTYAYGSSGALESTVTSGFADEDFTRWVKFSEAEYEGLMNSERIRAVTNYDLLGTELTFMEYIYDDSGALDKTVTGGYEDEERKILYKFSETDYTGLMSHERVDSVESYDLEETVLTTTDYDYGQSGAIEKTTTDDTEGRKISGSIYEGLKSSERVARIEGFNPAGERINFTDYLYDAAGALKTTFSYDANGVKQSGIEYQGPKGMEKSNKSSVYKDDGTSILNVTVYEYDDSGALTRSIAWKGESIGDRKLSETRFTGLSGREKEDLSINYDSNGYIQAITYYLYNDDGDGALRETRTEKPQEKVFELKPDTSTRVISRTYYYGLRGFEISDLTINLKDDDDEKSRTYYFYESFIGFESGEAVYEVVMAEDAFRSDRLAKAETYIIDEENGDADDLLLESIAYYKGAKGKEVIDFSQGYEFKPEDKTQRQVGSTTIYEYDAERALRASYTYAGGSKASREVEGLKREYLSRYVGEKGEEKIDYMEGTTCEYDYLEEIKYMEGAACEYYMDKYTEWDFFIRTGFNYDDEGRNTGYFEKIITPDTEWDWSVEKTDDLTGVLVDAIDVKFSDFDEKDRYGKIEKTYFDWDEIARDYLPTGKIVIQESFQYDTYDNITSYLETDIEPGEETKRYKFTFDEYTDKKPGVTISWELDETFTETGDYLKKYDIVYDEYARMIAYTQESCKDGEITTSYIFDIIYEKDRVTKEKVSTTDEVIYFEINDDDDYSFPSDYPFPKDYQVPELYSVREYAYNERKQVETTILKNGDFVSVSDAEGNGIYFEWTPAMAPYRERDFVSEREPEGPGPRTGSLDPSDSVMDILGEARKYAEHDEIKQKTSIHTTGGQVDQITDSKGNIFVYSDNKLVELQNDSGKTVVKINYTPGDNGELTVTLIVSQENPEDDFIAAAYTYDKDYRKREIFVYNPAGTELKHETYDYKPRDGADGTIGTVTIYRKFLEDGSFIEVDKIETYDENELLEEIFTHTADPDGKSFVARWTVEGYDDEDRLTSSREIRCESILTTLENYTSINAKMDNEVPPRFRTDDRIFQLIEDFDENEAFDYITESEKLDFGKNKLLINVENREVEYKTDGNIDKTTDNKKVYRYAPVENLIALPGTSHVYAGGVNPALGIDADFDTPHSDSVGRSRGASVSSTHIFNSQSDSPVDIKEIRFRFAVSADAWGYDEYGASISTSYGIDILKDGKWNSLDGITDLENVIEVDLKEVEGIRAWASADNSIRGGKGDGYAKAAIYEIQAINPDTECYNFFKVSDISKVFDAEEYNEQNNILGYFDKTIENFSTPDINGKPVIETELVTDTHWTAGYEQDDGAWSKIYDVDRLMGFTRTCHKTHPSDSSLDTVETTIRRNIEYEKENIISYTEEFNSDSSPDLRVERDVCGMTYLDGKNSGYREVTRQYNNNVLMNTTKTVRHNMVYNGWGDLTDWVDDYTPDVSDYKVYPELEEIYNNSQELQDIFDKNNNWKGSGDWDGKTIIHWAQEQGYLLHEKLYMYAPWERKAENCVYDENGQMLTCKETETGYKDLGAKQREWEKKETTRIFTIYCAPNWIKNYFINVKIYEKIFSDGEEKIVEKETYRRGENELIYDQYGRKYSYTVINGAETSRVDSSIYNSLGQLMETYAKIDANSYSKTYYFYDKAGNISQTKYYYYYHQETEQSDRNGRYNVIQHCEKTIWYDKYGDKTSENTNQYTDVQVISQSFWATFFGRAIISVISAILNAIPGPGPFLSMAFNTAISIIQGTFDWVSLASQIVTFGLRQYGADLLKSIPGLEGMQKFFGDVLGIGRDAASTGWDMFLPNAVLGSTQALVGEGIYEVGRENEWDPFLTSAVASFSSTAVGFAYGSATGRVKFTNMMDIGKYFAIEAAKSLAMASIDKFVEENPSDWARFMAPIAKMAINQISSLPKEDKAMPDLREIGIKKVEDIKKDGANKRIVDAAKEAGVNEVKVYEDTNTREIYYGINIEDALKFSASPLLQKIAGPDGVNTLGRNIEFMKDRNAELELVMSKNGEESYLRGMAWGSELRGQAKEWAVRAGLGLEDKIKFELNLRTGDLFMFIDVRNVISVFTQQEGKEREDVSRLKQMALNICGSLENIKSLAIAVRINGDASELVNATMIVGSAKISDRVLSEKVHDYLSSNFSGLRSEHADMVLDIDPKNARTTIRGLSLNPNEACVKKLLDSLKKQTAKLQKLGQEIEALVKLADNDPKNFERIILSVGKRGEYYIQAKIRSDVLRDLPALMSKLGIQEGSPGFNKLSEYEFANLLIDVKYGAYLIDLLLECWQAESSLLEMDKTSAKEGMEDSLIKEQFNVEKTLNSGSIFFPMPGLMLVNHGGLSTGVILGLECGYDAFTFLKEGALSLKESATPFLNSVDTGAKIGQKIPGLIIAGFEKLYTMARQSWLETSIDIEGRKADFWMDVDSKLAYWSDVTNYFVEGIGDDIEYAGGFWREKAIDAKDWLIGQAIYWGDVGKNFIEGVKDDIVYAGGFWKDKAIEAKDWLVGQAIYWGDVGKNFVSEIKDDIIYARDFWIKVGINHFQNNAVGTIRNTQNSTSGMLRSVPNIRIMNDVFRFFVNTEIGQKWDCKFWGYKRITYKELIAQRCRPTEEEATTRVFLGIANGKSDAYKWETMLNEPYHPRKNPNSLFEERNILKFGNTDVVSCYTQNRNIDCIQVIFNTVLGIKTPATKIITHYNDKPIENEFFHSGAGCADFLHGNHYNSKNGYYFGVQISLSGAQKNYASEAYVGTKDWVARLYLLPPLPYNNVIHVPDLDHDLEDYFRFKAERQSRNE